MKTTLNHNDLNQFERLVAKLVKATDLPQTVAFFPRNRGLLVSAVTANAVLTMEISAPEISSSFTLPWAAVKELAVKKRDSVELMIEDGAVQATYTLGGVPQQRLFTTSNPTAEQLPYKPEKRLTHTTKLFDALVDAAKCTDQSSMRYALGSVCLRGAKSQIASSDGRQALMQGGFNFPWNEDVLCPVSKIFGAKELRERGEVVQVGSGSDWLYFAVGNVCFWLKSIEGKFPQLERLTQQTDNFYWATIDRSDADFVSQRLDNLPGKADEGSPVCIVLNQCFAVRGHGQTQQPPSRSLLPFSLVVNIL